jgi:murein DD-endopeptidase MepM/ murein hydrolase activator NlpD
MALAQIPFEDTRKTGYQFGQKIASPVNTYHPGTDANQGATGSSDEGLPVQVLAVGKVVYAKNAGAGWGNLVVIEHPELSKLWPTGYVASRYAHLSRIDVKVGDIVTMESIVGLCGHTGSTKTNPISAHSHYEVIQKKLPSFTHYPNKKGLQYVLEYWVDPYDFIREINLKTLIKEDPIVKWHKENKIIEAWSDPATKDELRLGYAVYKGLKALKEDRLSFTL